MCAFAFTPDLFHFANKRAIESERERLYLGFYSIFLGSFMLARSRSVVVAIERQRKDFGSCLGALDACVHARRFFLFPRSMLGVMGGSGSRQSWVVVVRRIQRKGRRRVLNVIVRC